MITMDRKVGHVELIDEKIAHQWLPLLGDKLTKAIEASPTKRIALVYTSTANGQYVIDLMKHEESEKEWKRWESRAQK